ncbi:MAG: glutaminyl-peptide cyclotransferase [Pyrinomonadaceae bacterium]
MKFFIVIVLVVFTTMCTTSESPNSNATSPATASKPAPVATVSVVREFPHDPSAFTQGLVFYDGLLYEGTGGSRERGDTFQTTLRKVDLDSGRVLKQVSPPEDIFGEGIAILNDKIYQLSWQKGVAFRYNLADFKYEKSFTYVGEGWGLATNGTELIQTNGTNRISFVNPENFETVRTIDVNNENGSPVNELNEIEFIKGEIWANIWQTDRIVRIDPKSGAILGWVDLGDIVRDEESRSTDSDNVLNGIAYDDATNRLFVTGKRWSRLFEVKLNNAG